MQWKFRLPGALAAVCLADAAEPSERIEVLLERNRNGAVEQLPADAVCDNGDLIRFRFKVGFDGYLYVTNLATSGKYSQLFPQEQTGVENRVEKDREYVLPANDSGWFRLAAPAGYETVYWLVSRTPLPRRRMPPDPPAPGTASGDVTPRCDDALFRARGECVDRAAGPRAVRSGVGLPPGFPEMRPRELDFVSNGKTTTIVGQGQADEPFIYVFRLAHR